MYFPCFRFILKAFMVIFHNYLYMDLCKEKSYIYVMINFLPQYFQIKVMTFRGSQLINVHHTSDNI